MAKYRTTCVNSQVLNLFYDWLVLFVENQKPFAAIFHFTTEQNNHDATTNYCAGGGGGGGGTPCPAGGG